MVSPDLETLLCAKQESRTGKIQSGWVTRETKKILYFHLLRISPMFNHLVTNLSPALPSTPKWNISVIPSSTTPKPSKKETHRNFQVTAGCQCIKYYHFAFLSHKPPEGTRQAPGAGAVARCCPLEPSPVLIRLFLNGVNLMLETILKLPFKSDLKEFPIKKSR